MTLTVGITGGIGSGKSTICKIFRLLNVPVFEADLEAKKLIHSNSVIKAGLIDLFGEAIYTADGTVDRKELAKLIFNDENQLAKVNKLVHPLIRAEFKSWLEKQSAPYIIHEAAILFESGFYKMMDYTILVSAPENIRIERVSKRDNVTREQVKERIQKQWTDQHKRELATLEIKNDNKELIIPQIIEIDKQIKEYGKVW
jgi:dephospho-CoA kinase